MVSEEEAFTRRLGQEIRAWREHRGLTGEALAAEAGRPADLISAIEHGDANAGVETLFRIAAALEIEPIRLIEAAEGSSDRESGAGAASRRRSGQSGTEPESGPTMSDEEAAPDLPEPDDEGGLPEWVRVVDPVEADILQAILQRERSPQGFPGRKAIHAMEEPLRHLVRACVLFYDLAAVAREGDIRLPGLLFLSRAMEQEATRVYRLYSGNPPCSD